MPRQQRQRGFTLLELAIVLVIIAVLSAGVAPAFVGAMTRTHLRTHVWQVASQLSSTRAQAVTSQLLCRVRYEALERTFTAETEPDPASAPGTFEPLTDPALAQLTVPEDFAQIEVLGGVEPDQAPLTEIYFQPDGRTDGATILLTPFSGQPFTLTLTRNTGQVRVVEGTEAAL